MSSVGLRLACCAGIALIACPGMAQVPDVLVHLDLRLNYRTLNDGGTSIRWFDTLGNPSTVALALNLEPGLKMVMAQRLERIPHDGDPDQLDEYYVEDEGNWRIGKQVLPFGPRFLNRECALGARTDTSFFVGKIPLSLAVCDAGDGRQRGIVGRFGTRLGVSFEVGNHFGISATSLSVLRRADDSPGIGHGYRQVFGLDYSKAAGELSSTIEFVAVRQGATRADFDENVLDLRATLKPDRYRSITVGITRAFDASTTVMRAGGSIYAYKGATVEPLVRYKDGKLLDFALTLRVKL